MFYLEPTRLRDYYAGIVIKQGEHEVVFGIINLLKYLQDWPGLITLVICRIVLQRKRGFYWLQWFL